MMTHGIKYSGIDQKLDSQSVVHDQNHWRYELWLSEIQALEQIYRMNSTAKQYIFLPFVSLNRQTITKMVLNAEILETI